LERSLASAFANKAILVMPNFKNLYPFNHLNTGQEIHAEIDKLPDDALFGVLLLFQYEHVMVEKLLQLLVGEVDTNLFETVKLLVKVMHCLYKIYHFGMVR
jgi:hypothetical protein